MYDLEEVLEGGNDAMNKQRIITGILILIILACGVLLDNRDRDADVVFYEYTGQKLPACMPTKDLKAVKFVAGYTIIISSSEKCIKEFLWANLNSWESPAEVSFKELERTVPTAIYKSKEFSVLKQNHQVMYRAWTSVKADHNELRLVTDKKSVCFLILLKG